MAPGRQPQGQGRRLSMNLMRWTPWRELEALTDPLNRFFACPDTRRSTGKEMMPVADWAVSVDINDTDGDFHIRTRFSRLKDEAVRVTLDKGRFTLQGEPNKANRKRSDNCMSRQHHYGSFATRPDRLRSGLPKPVGQPKTRKTGTCSTSIIGVVL